MINIQSNECVGFSPEDVFRVGMCAETWPQMKGFILQPGQEVLALGGLLRVGLQTPKIELDGFVTECETARLVVIEGESNIASVKVRFMLEGRADGATNVSYDTDMGLKGRGIANKMAERAIGVFMERTIPVFTKQYIANITATLEKDALTLH